MLKENVVIEGDCLLKLTKIPNESIDTIYLDPPFYTQRKHNLTSKTGDKYSFDDTWDSMEEYLLFLKKRLFEMKRILKNTGNIFFHCDKNASHYIKILLDEVFDSKNFQSEIIWTYKRWSNSKKGLLDTHQNIFQYSKTKNNKFNVIYTNYSPTTNIDQILQERERDINGKTIYKKIDGKIVKASPKKGVPLSNVWEIPFLNPKAKERVGYPTQKPLELIEKIIEISSDENDIILDPFCGSGTTLVAAKRLNRKYIGIDKNIDAINLSNARLKNPIKTNSQLLQKGISSYDNKSEFEKSILNQFNCNIVQRNKGIDAILKKEINGKGVGIRIQKENEDLKDSINLLLDVIQKKELGYGILIQTKLSNEIFIPNNIILIPEYSFQLKAFAENLGK